MAKKKTTRKTSSTPTISPLRDTSSPPTSNEFYLFPPSDTIINCNTPDGKVIPIDAMDLDDMLIEVYQDYGNKELIHQEYLPAMIEKFFNTYGFRMSRRSMELLMQKKHEILDTIKKNTYQSCDPTNSME